MVKKKLRQQYCNTRDLVLPPLTPRHSFYKNGVLKVLVQRMAIFMLTKSSIQRILRLFVGRLPATAIEGKKGSGLEPRRDSGSITRYTVSSTRYCGLDAQAAKIDDPAEALVSLLSQLPLYLPMKLTTKPTKPN